MSLASEGVITFTTTPAIKAKLVDEANKHGMSLSELCRRVMLTYLLQISGEEKDVS